MNSHGWSHDVPGDPVHFDHLSSPDIRGQDVQAFQRLWNRNNPDDEIAEDGVYGPQTEARLRAAPATGFEIGADCATTNERAIDVVMIEGPDKVAPGAEVAYQITFANQSGVDFSSAVRVVANDDTLHDASWTSSTEVGTLGELGAGDVGDGGQGVIESTSGLTVTTGLFLRKKRGEIPNLDAHEALWLRRGNSDRFPVQPRPRSASFRACSASA